MPGHTKAIVSDVNAKPAPQIFDPSKDAYDYLLGQNGAMRTLLYDASGNPLLTQANPGYADLVDRAARVLGKISADDGAIAALGALAAAAITDPAQNASVIALLKGLLKQLQGTGTGATPVSLTGSLPTKPPAIETLVNAQSLAAGTTIEAVIDPQGAKRIILAVNSDKLWKLATNSFWTNVPGVGGKDHTYPDCYTNAQPAAPSGNYPKQVIIGMFAGKATDELMALRNQVIPANIKVAITNVDTTTATITVKVMRIWEVA